MKSKNNNIKEWFASEEYKAFRKWVFQHEETVKLIAEVTKNCKNEYDAPVVFNDKDTWREGECYHCCEMWSICGKSNYKMIYIDEKGKRVPFP